jgi:hypothetical protein
MAQRLQRLEWTTRFRPVHIGALLLGAVAPKEDREFLYASEGTFAGEAAAVLQAAGVATTGKSAEAALSEFQRGGFLLAHVLECPLDEENSGQVRQLLEACLPAALARIRRSLKPKRLVLLSQELEFALPRFQPNDLNCQLVLDAGKPFHLHPGQDSTAAQRLRKALVASGAAAR